VAVVEHVGIPPAPLIRPDLGHPTAAEARSRAETSSGLHAFLSLTDDLAGTPAVAVKDLIDVRGSVTTAGGTLLPPHPAEADAPVIARLREAGCSIVGKTGLDEFAFGSTSTNPHYGDVLNPRDPSRAAGGSSGGSAVAAAIGACAFAIGTDTGGSIRIPSSLCGVVGVKPTLGLIPTEGVIPLSTTLDTLGPIAANVARAAAGLELLAGIPVFDAPGAAARAYRIGVARAWAGALDAPTAVAWAWATDGLPEVELPSHVEPSDLGLTVLYYDAARYHAHWLEHEQERYGAKIVAKLRQGLSIADGAYEHARAAMGPTREAFEAAMDGFDAFIVPATACVAPPVTTADEWHEPLTRFMRPFNLTGQPVVALPVPRPGPPVGVQLVGRCGGDADLIPAAAALERRWSERGSDRT
jgi:aspartyl-tRNA(Asn)/glutamyl-tRNA(Gln) amidotransferase subunit A